MYLSVCCYADPLLLAIALIVWNYYWMIFRLTQNKRFIFLLLRSRRLQVQKLLVEFKLHTTIHIYLHK